MRVVERAPSQDGAGLRPRRSLTRRIVRAFGYVCLAGAVAVGAHLGWLLWGTGLATRRAQEDLRPAFERLVANPRPLPPADPGGQEAAPPRLPGEAVAIIQIPRMDLDMLLVEGTGTEDLKKGPGHYAGTAMPWDPTGAVGIAGHRTTYGGPFWDLDVLAKGDRIILITEYGRFDYTVTGSRVIDPSDASVLEQTQRPTLVLTTCEPRFKATYRLVVFADRQSA